MDESNTAPEKMDKQIKKTSRLAIASLVASFFALLGFLFCFYCEGNLPRPFYVSSLIRVTVLCIIVLALCIIALIAILVRSKQLKGRRYAIASIIVTALILGMLLPTLGKEREFSKCSRCGRNLWKLGAEIRTYAKAHDGYLPAATKWCDLLIEHNKSLPKDIYKCPSAKHGSCNYAFNKNLDCLRLADVPDTVVLLFEADEGWNLTGGVELLTTRHHSGCNVLFANGSVPNYHEGILERIKDPTHWEIKAALEQPKYTFDPNYGSQQLPSTTQLKIKPLGSPGP